MNKTRRFLPTPILAAAFFAMALGQTFNAHAANVRVSRFWHNHQPIYWPEWNNNIGENNRVQFAQDSIVLKPGQLYDTTTSHPDNNLTDIFGHGDRVASYQSGPRNSLASLSSSAGYAISYSGSLMENVRSLGRANNLGYGSGWYNGNREAMGWTTPSGGPRMDMVGFTYHHSLGSVIPKAVFRKELQIFKQVWWKAWGKNSNLSDHSKGYFPTEMAFTTEMVDVLRDEGYEWVIVASHHLSRTCPTYLQQGTAESNYGINSSPPNKADQLGPSPTTGWWYGSPNPGNAAWNVSPFAYQLHKVKYVNPSNGTEKTMIAVPSDDVLSYKAGYSGAEIGMVSGNIAPFATDATRPAIVLPATDGDNAWGGGSSSWNESTPSFFSACESSGYGPTSIQDFVNQFGANAPVTHIEDGAWIFPEMCYGSPYFLKWVDPPTNPKNLASCYPNTQVDLETPGFALKFWNWAPVIAGANWCETAEQILEDEGGSVADWKIATPYDWDGTYTNPNEVERAWHIYLAGLDSGFNYYGGMGNDDEVKQSLANRRSIEMLTPWLTSNRRNNDRTPPTIFRPQRFPYNPGAQTFGWFNVNPTNGNFRKTMGSDFYIWTHAYDISGIPDGGVVLKVRRDKDGVNSMSTTDNETYAGGSDVEGWVTITMNKRVLPKTRAQLNAAADNGQIDYFIEAAEIADYYFGKVTGYRNELLDYYIEAQDTKGNLYKSDIQHVYVADDGSPAGSKPSTSFSPVAPSDCAPITVNFNAATSVLATATTVNAFYHFSTNASDWVTTAMTRTSTNTFTLTFSTNQIPDNAPQLEIAFTDGVNWESNGGANWKVAIQDCDAPAFVNGVSILPAMPTAGQSVTVSYDPTGRALASASAVNMHHGYNGANWTTVPGVAMSKPGAYWTYTYTVPASASNIVMCFNNGTTWDNNGGNNWTFSVTPTIPPPPVPNGVVITNPAVGTITVANATTSYTLQGTAGTNLTGNLLWTNSASRLGGSFTRETYWSLPSTLEIGDNVLSVSGVIAGSGSSSVLTVAVDSASSYVAWTNGSAQGSGWSSAWDLAIENATAGHFLATNAANCSAGNPAFGLWANSGGTSRAKRILTDALQVGDTFSFLFDNNWIQDGGSTGFALENASGENLVKVYFIGGEGVYKLEDNAGIRDTGISWTGDGIAVSLKIESATTYTLFLNGVPFTGTLTAAAAGTQARQFHTWNYNCGTDTERNVYFNSLAVTRSQAGGSESYSTATVHVIREGGGTPPPTISDVDLDLSGNGLQFRMSNSIPGAQYAVYATPFLFPSQNWRIVEGTVTNGTGAAIDLSITNGLLPTNYYRIGYIAP